jgi:hypothetical protein
MYDLRLIPLAPQCADEPSSSHTEKEEKEEEGWRCRFDRPRHTYARMKVVEYTTGNKWRCIQKIGVWYRELSISRRLLYWIGRECDSSF